MSCAAVLVARRQAGDSPAAPPCRNPFGQPNPPVRQTGAGEPGDPAGRPPTAQSIANDNKILRPHANRDVPFRRILAWAAATAAAVAMANVAVDRFALRREPPDNA